MGTLKGMRLGSASLPLLDSVACLDGLWTVEELWSNSSSRVIVASASRPRALISGMIGSSPSRLFYLYVFLRPDKDIPHLDNFVLHQMFIEGVGNLLIGAKPALENVCFYEINEIMCVLIFPRYFRYSIGLTGRIHREREAIEALTVSIHVSC